MRPPGEVGRNAGGRRSWDRCSRPMLSRRLIVDVTAHVLQGARRLLGQGASGPLRVTLISTRDGRDYVELIAVRAQEH